MTSANVRVGLLGACGRMGNLLIRRILATEGMELSAAFDLVNIGKDIGEAIGVGPLGVPVSDSKDLAKVLKESRTTSSSTSPSPPPPLSMHLPQPRPA